MFIIERVAIVYELKDLEYHLGDFLLMLLVGFFSLVSFLKVNRQQERDEITRDLTFEVCQVLAGHDLGRIKVEERLDAEQAV